ncbi:MAG: DUF362 domain-containing protein [Defluviitaleaceae bacterium]|nr:DUF362 domain-containing protein [Defluviitaleaceae bacterium]
MEYIYQTGGTCAIAEGANGYLEENLIASGFGNMLNRHDIKVVDVDLEDCDEVEVYGECHYIPKCFKDYAIRIAMPSASKRKDMLYSNNIKLFFGAVPRRMYQPDGADMTEQHGPRIKLHDNLQPSVANMLAAIQNYSEFQLFVNGGSFYNEKQR